MQRLILDSLNTWRYSHRRKPLILMGARQVGKTWALKEFGKSYKDSLYINFDKDEDYADIFKRTKDVKRIIDQLSMIRGMPISKDTLIVFDEIQECEEALGTLKYFCEDAPEYHVAAAGSFLGLSLAKGFPVGKVNFMNMHPVTFTEFLQAVGEQGICDYISSIDKIEAIPAMLYNKLYEYFKLYFVTGGMPEVVDSWINYKDFSEVRDIQQEILFSYERDISKYLDGNNTMKAKYIWDSVVSQLSRENKKFLYSVVKNGARAREYETALNWIVNAGFLKRVYALTKPSVPITSYRDLAAFKIYMVDVGLLRRMAGVSNDNYLDDDRMLVEFKGAFTENYVLQALTAGMDIELAYWKDTKHEVDFVLQQGDNIYPLEVKSGKSISSASFKRYGEKYSPDIMIRTSLKNLSLDGKVLNIPLFLLDHVGRLVDLARNF